MENINKFDEDTPLKYLEFIGSHNTMRGPQVVIQLIDI